MKNITIAGVSYPYKFGRAVWAAFEKRTKIRVSQLQEAFEMEHQLLLCYLALEFAAKVNGDKLPFDMEKFTLLDYEHEFIDEMWEELEGSKKKQVALIFERDK